MLLCASGRLHFCKPCGDAALCYNLLVAESLAERLIENSSKFRDLLQRSVMHWRPCGEKSVIVRVLDMVTD